MKKLALASICGLLLTAGMADAQVVVRVGPPAPRVEHIPPPRAGYAWHAGYYRYDGGRYVWMPGAYVRPPRAGGVWVEGHWRESRGGWVWQEGHWRY